MVDPAPVLSLPLEIESVRLRGLSQATAAGWIRHTTVVELRGAGQVGSGEDVTYAEREQRAFQSAGAPGGLTGATTVGAFADRVASLSLFEEPPAQETSRLYRRWAFESAGLDLALKQNGQRLERLLERPPLPVRFVHSTGLGEPPSSKRLRERGAAMPGLRFKIDYERGWSDRLLAELAALDAVDVVDFKGHYHGSFEGPPADAEAYRRVAEALPGAWLEDPAWTADTAEALEPFRDRVTWDAVLHRVSDLETLPFAPRCINVKPSRFGSLAELLGVYAWAERHDVACYGGGQYELGCGRLQIQHLASLFHADAANDVAPAAYHRFPWTEPPPASPLPPVNGFAGFGGPEPS